MKYQSRKQYALSNVSCITVDEFFPSVFSALIQDDYDIHLSTTNMADGKASTPMIKQNENSTHDDTDLGFETSLHCKPSTSSSGQRFFSGTPVEPPFISLPSSLTPTFHRNGNVATQQAREFSVCRSNELVPDHQSIILPNEDAILFEAERNREEPLRTIVANHIMRGAIQRISVAQAITPGVSGNGFQSGLPATIHPFTSNGTSMLPTPPVIATSLGDKKATKHDQTPQSTLPELIEATPISNASLQSLPATTTLCFNPAALDFVPRYSPENGQAQLGSPQVQLSSTSPYNISSDPTFKYHNCFEAHSSALAETEWINRETELQQSRYQGQQIEAPAGYSAEEQRGRTSQTTEYQPRRRAPTIERAARNFEKRKREEAEALAKAKAEAQAEAQALQLKADAEASEFEFEQMIAEIENFGERRAGVPMEPTLQSERAQGWDSENPDEYQSEEEPGIASSTAEPSPYRYLPSPFGDSPAWAEIRESGLYSRFWSLRDAELRIGFPFLNLEEIDWEDRGDGNWSVAPAPEVGISEYSTVPPFQRSEYFEVALQTRAASYHHDEPENGESSRVTQQRNERRNAPQRERSLSAERGNSEDSYSSQQRYERYALRHRERPIPVEQTQAYHEQPYNSQRQGHPERVRVQSARTYVAPRATPGPPSCEVRQTSFMIEKWGRATRYSDSRARIGGSFNSTQQSSILQSTRTQHGARPDRTSQRLPIRILHRCHPADPVVTIAAAQETTPLPPLQILRRSDSIEPVQRLEPKGPRNPISEA